LGELFKVEVDVFSEAGYVGNFHYGRMHTIFSGWIARFGNPPNIFTFPLSESTRTS
jgi:hypothetical protein